MTTGGCVWTEMVTPVSVQRWSLLSDAVWGFGLVFTDSNGPNTFLPVRSVLSLGCKSKDLKFCLICGVDYLSLTVLLHRTSLVLIQLSCDAFAHLV